MQGALEHEQPPKTISSALKEIYENRVPPSDLFKMDKMSLPVSFDAAISRLKINMKRFAFYYILFFATFDLFFVFINKYIVIPILIAIGCIYLYYNQVNIKGYVINQNYVIIGFIVTNLLIYLISGSMRYSYILFFALNSFLLGVISLHGSVINTDIDNEADKV